jgi:thiosulfate dehydrogenase
MRFLIGLLIGLLVVPLGIAAYLSFGSLPVATSDAPLPFEERIVHLPLHARIDCHGLYGRPASFAKGMYPEAPQLWEPHRDGVVGVSDDPPGETYWKVANGIRLTGMPAFKKFLNQTEMWQVSQLLANADKPLPPGVLELLKRPLDLDPAAPQ